jgi:SAM-dependent methyltransferase
MDTNNLKLIVQEKYGQIAKQGLIQNQSSCCGSTSCCSDVDYAIFSENYTGMDGYNADADLGLGCGLPTEFAGIKKGDAVLDLGCGAGNDCFVARAETGPEGKVTGLDFTDEMLDKARANNLKLGFENVEFFKGDIEEMPLPKNCYDVVISNCVLNLVPDKAKAFAEIFRVLKQGGHFSISDVVISGELPVKIKKDAEMYAGCVSGAIQKEEYLKIVKEAGFTEIAIQKEKEILIPDEILLKYLTPKDLDIYKQSQTGIFSITLKAKK